MKILIIETLLKSGFEFAGQSLYERKTSLNMANVFCVEFLQFLQTHYHTVGNKTLMYDFASPWKI